MKQVQVGVAVIYRLRYALHPTHPPLILQLPVLVSYKSMTFRGMQELASPCTSFAPPNSQIWYVLHSPSSSKHEQG